MTTSPNTPPTIIKSPIDPNDYKVITLSNGLKALLISTNHEKSLEERDINPRTGIPLDVEEFNRKFVKIDDPQNEDDHNEDEWKSKKNKSKLKNWEEVGFGDAYACLVIEAGHIHDPEGFEGLAHLCEHLCFGYGTKNHPKHFGLFDVLDSCLGWAGASTYFDCTTFNFHINLDVAGLDRFELALDMLSETVSCPLMPLALFQKELKDLENELGLLKLSDVTRLDRLLRSLAKATHPIQAVESTSVHSLRKPNLYSTLLSWKSRHYTANNMVFVLKAGLPLAELEDLTLHYFSKIPAGNKEMVSPTAALVRKHGNPFDTPEFHKLIKMVPVEDIDFLCVTWVLDSPKYLGDYETKPFLYLRYFFQEDNTFMEYLAGEGLAYNLDVTFHSDIGFRHFCSPFTLMIHLTKKGLENYDSILLAVFSYLRFVREIEPQARNLIFNEIRREKSDFFINKETLTDLQGILTAGRNLLYGIPIQHILTAPVLVTGANWELVSETLRLFTADNMNLILGSKSLMEECLQTEPIFKTKYSKLDFSPEFLWACNGAGIRREFELPANPANPFRPQDFKCPDGGKEIKITNEKMKLEILPVDFCGWGEVPIAGYTLSLTSVNSPTIPENEVSTAFLSIWRSILADLMRKEIIQCLKAGIYVELKGRNNSIQLEIEGPSWNLKGFFVQFIQKFIAFEETAGLPRLFEDYKNLCIQTLGNKTNDTNNYAEEILRFILEERHKLPGQIRAVAKDATFRDFQLFVKAFLSRMSVGVLVVGSVGEKDAQEIKTVLEETAGKYEKPFKLASTPPTRLMGLPLGERCIAVRAKIYCTQNSTIVNYYQFGDYARDQSLDMLLAVLRYYAFLQLRTVEKLSYAVEVEYENFGLTIAVHPLAVNHTVGYVDERIDFFLLNFRKVFPSYEKLKSSANCKSGFGSREDYNKILQLYDNFLLPNGQDFRKVSIQVVGYVYPSDSSELKSQLPAQPNRIKEKMEMYKSDVPLKKRDKDSSLDLEYDFPEGVKDKNGYFITDLQAFKNSLTAFPIVVPVESEDSDENDDD